MGLFALEDRVPNVQEGSYVSPDAHIIGDVHIGKGCWIGPGAVIRADFGTIEIGSHTAVEENCVIHCRPECTCRIGDYVTIGHGALLHGATIEDYVTVGMGSVVGVNSVLKQWCILGEGTVVKSNQEISAAAVAVGSPAKEVRHMTDEEKDHQKDLKQFYVDLPERYLGGLKQL
jgi:phenylacetic acid degradation protein